MKDEVYAMVLKKAVSKKKRRCRHGKAERKGTILRYAWNGVFWCPYCGASGAQDSKGRIKWTLPEVSRG